MGSVRHFLSVILDSYPGTQNNQRSSRNKAGIKRLIDCELVEQRALARQSPPGIDVFKLYS